MNELDPLRAQPAVRPAVYDTVDSIASVFNININSTVNGSYVSCGVSVLTGLSYSTPKQIVDKVLKERSHTDYKKIREAFVTFSDTNHTSRNGGNALCAYIRENNLGAISEFGPRMNPNTGNMIKFWVWEPPHESLAPHHKYMPVYGFTLKMDKYGVLSTYVSDPSIRQGAY